MYLIPEPVATKQVSGIAEPSLSRPSPSKTYHHHQPEKSSLPHSKTSISHRRRYYSSDEEDDSRDRQSHWKRIKTQRSDDHPRETSRNLIRYTERDRFERSSPRSRVQAPPHPHTRPGHRVIVLKGEEDAGLLRRSSRESYVSKGWDVTGDMRLRDGGTASPKDFDPGSKRKHHESLSTGSRSSSSIMCEGVRENNHMARRAPVEKGYEIRVSGREVVGEFVHNPGEGLFLEDSRHADDPARMDPCEGLNRRSRGGETMSRESSRGLGDRKTEPLAVRVRRVEFDLSVGNGKGASAVVRKVLDVGRTSRSEGKEHGASAAGVGEAKKEASGGDVESERRPEKRERWAEKERDLEKELEKENMPKTQTTTKTVTVVDHSHKFTVAKAPISKPSILLSSVLGSGFVQTLNPRISLADALLPMVLAMRVL